MIKRFLTVLSLLFFCASTSAYADCTVEDDTGQTLHLAEPAQRIISLAPALTEILFAAGAGDHVVGVAAHSDYPAAAKKIPVVAGYSSLNVEAIAAKHPDLIVAWKSGNPLGQLQALKKLGLPIYYSEPHSLKDIAKELRNLGCLADTTAVANAAADNFMQRYTTLKERYANAREVSVFFQVWPAPLLTVGKTSFINQVIELCGGKNVFTQVNGLTTEVNLEAVLKANPEVIIGDESIATWQAQWKKWPQLAAVKNNFLFAINPDVIQRASPRLLDGAELLCSDLDKVRAQPTTS